MMMHEPTRNDRCSELPRTIGCTADKGWRPVLIDERIHLDAAKSAAMMHAVKKAAADGLIINWNALAATIRMTCWC